MARFDEARWRALLHDLWQGLQGRPTDLLPFDVVREGLRLRHFVDRGIREIPLAAIVGSIGRIREFNRAFLPRDEALRDRWEEVRLLALSPTGFPPVEVYQVGDAYFVVDGHHRVSVARSFGAPTIEAWVREFESPVPLSADSSLESVLLQSGLADFLETTGLGGEGAELFRMSEGGGYQRLLDHISVHRYFRGIETGQPVSWPEAVRSWYATVFVPGVEAIRRSGLLADFPGRTEADLYLFVMDRLHLLRERFGVAGANAERAVADLSRRARRQRRLAGRRGRPPGPEPPAR
ncbi:MAG: transcriptional regulator [Holophagales bacterium]|nr:MAG: transcriptional regulator [Holophagales bacterium]